VRRNQAALSADGSCQEYNSNVELESGREDRHFIKGGKITLKWSVNLSITLERKGLNRGPGKNLEGAQKAHEDISFERIDSRKRVLITPQ